jgi:uncharacterized membrane protein
VTSRQRKRASDGIEPHKSARQQQSEAVRRRTEVSTANGNNSIEEIEAERFWSGILPRPEDFAKFNDVVPGASERILRMAELEQAHRIEIEKTIIPENLSAGRGASGSVR